MADAARSDLVSRPVSFGDTRALIDRSNAKVTELRKMGLTETAEMISRMVERSLSQEKRPYEERDRSHDLKMKLTEALTKQRTGETSTESD